MVRRARLSLFESVGDEVQHLALAVAEGVARAARRVEFSARTRAARRAAPVRPTGVYGADSAGDLLGRGSFQQIALRPRADRAEDPLVGLVRVKTMTRLAGCLDQYARQFEIRAGSHRAGARDDWQGFFGGSSAPTT
jgi:hypothetical protein